MSSRGWVQISLRNIYRSMVLCKKDWPRRNKKHSERERIHPIVVEHQSRKLSSLTGTLFRKKYSAGGRFLRERKTMVHCSDQPQARIFLRQKSTAIKNNFRPDPAPNLRSRDFKAIQSLSSSRRKHLFYLNTQNLPRIVYTRKRTSSIDNTHPELKNNKIWSIAENCVRKGRHRLTVPGIL